MRPTVSSALRRNLPSLAVLAVASSLAACGGGASVPSDNGGSTLYTVYGSGQPVPRLTDLPFGGVKYRLPTDAAGRMGYVMRPVTETSRNEVTLHVRVTGRGTVHPVNGDQDCTGQPAHAQVMIQREGDDWLAKEGTTEHYRWWARQPIPLEVGTDVTVTVSFADLDQWSSIYGKRATDYPEAFHDAIAHAERIGITHGGCGAAGHGVYANGNVSVTIERLTIQ